MAMEDMDATPSPKKLRAAIRTNAYTLMAYASSIVFAPIVYHTLSNKEFSSVLTFGALLQCLGFVFLLLQQRACQGSCPVGLCAQTLVLLAVALVARLSSTVWLNGYLPLDRSGDFLYQMADLCSLFLVLHLVKRAPVAENAFDVRTVIIMALLLAISVHPSLDHYLFFDVAWVVGLYLEAAALVPHMLTEPRPKVSMHAAAALFFGRGLGALFWYHGFEDVAPRTGVNYAGWGILAAYAVQLLLHGELLTNAVFGATTNEVPLDSESSA